MKVVVVARVSCYNSLYLLNINVAAGNVYLLGKSGKIMVKEYDNKYTSDRDYS